MAPRSPACQKCGKRAEQRARQLDQGPATFESQDKNAEEQVLEKILRTRQAGCGTFDQIQCNMAPRSPACQKCGKRAEQRARQLDQGPATFESQDKNAEMTRQEMKRRNLKN